jgi:hypothetical protein
MSDELAREESYTASVNKLLLRIEELERENAALKERKLWSCPDCAFSFDAMHVDESGGYSCPVCAEARLEQENVVLKRAIEDANWLLSGHVDAGGGAVELVKWAQAVFGDRKGVTATRKELEKRLALARELLQQYGDHQDGCYLSGCWHTPNNSKPGELTYPERVCGCGFNAALTQLNTPAKVKE